MVRELTVLRAKGLRGLPWARTYPSIDVAAGKLYLVGTNVGVPVWDLVGNPANPTYLGQASTTGFHDLCVENGYAYASHIGGGVLRILDISTPMPHSLLSHTPTPHKLTPHARPNASGNVTVLAA